MQQPHGSGADGQGVGFSSMLQLGKLRCKSGEWRARDTHQGAAAGPLAKLPRERGLRKCCLVKNIIGHSSPPGGPCLMAPPAVTNLTSLGTIKHGRQESVFLKGLRQDGAGGGGGWGASREAARLHLSHLDKGL